MQSEFGDFATRGKGVDRLIVATAGEAFGIIGSSLIDDVLMPVIALVLARVDVSKLSLVLNNPNNVAVSSFAAAKGRDSYA